MKPFYVLMLMAMLYFSGCSSSSETVSYPIENLFRFSNVDEFGIAFGDSSLRGDYPGLVKTMLDSTNIKFFAFWQNMDQPVTWIRVHASDRELPPGKLEQMPHRWQTRDGVYASITIDSLQAINGKPFYVEHDGKYFSVVNWEEGKLAKSGIDMYMILEGPGKPTGYMTSQQIIDGKMKVRGHEMVVWRSGWPKENLAATNGVPGDYSAASTRLLTQGDIALLNHQGLRVMRNEIFARHGYIFQDEGLNVYFINKRWYNGRFENVDHLLTDIEKKNINLIIQREDYLFVNRPITALMKELPLLSLPIDLETTFAEGIKIPNDIEDPNNTILNDEWPDGDQELYGILPDTTRFYAVLWKGVTGHGVLAGLSTSIYVTTFDKKWKRIDGGGITVTHDPSRYGAGDCNWTEAFESNLYTNLSFRSKVKAYGCSNTFGSDGLPIPEHVDIAEGQINDDGTLRVSYDGGY